MKKLALLLSLLALGALGLTGCGGGDDQATAASETETTAASETDRARKPCGTYDRWGLAVLEGDISCRVVRRVIHDFAYNRLPGSWICGGPDGHVVCTKQPWVSSRIVVRARFDLGTRSKRERIATLGNEWAPLFATDAVAACRYYAGGQPACEREDCQRVGHTEPIRNCTPPASEFRESFANATVERVVLDAHDATAEFSNGESVQFHAGEYGRWFITKRWIKKITRSHGTGANPRLSNEERIEQMGNDWAALFAKADPATSGYYEGQPAWERERCRNIGGYRIKSCTPLSSEFRQSFANATVERVVVEGRHATAEFSNGESVEFVKGMFGTLGGSWSITVHTVMNFER